jgi:hypothetical protein
MTSFIARLLSANLLFQFKLSRFQASPAMSSTVIFYWFLNFAGVIYTSFVVVGVASLNLFYTCPAVYPEPGGCFMPGCFAALILAELIINLFLFHYNNKRNQVN